jgi:hypothetical protein
LSEFLQEFLSGFMPKAKDFIVNLAASVVIFGSDKTSSKNASMLMEKCFGRIAFANFSLKDT